jgi:hypothetical protein
MNRIRTTAVLVATLFIGVAHAAPITYSLAVTTTGRLGNTSFTNALVTLTSIGADTVSVTTPAGLPTRNVAPTAFSIAGVGSGTLAANTFWFVNTGECATGVACAGVSQVDGLSIAYGYSAVLFTYDLKTSIGPTGNGSSWVFPQQALATSAGTLVLNTLPGFQLDVGPATFMARVASSVPEPATLGLLALGLACVGAARRKLR